MSRNRNRSTLLVAAVLIATAVGALFLPRAVDQTVRAAVRDATLPGQRAAVALERRYGAWRLEKAEDRANAVDVAELKAVTSERDRFRAEARRLVAENLRLRKQAAVRDGDTGAPRGTEGDPLFVPELLSARLLGEAESKFWRAGRFVDQGSGAHITEDALVLAGNDSLIDQGSRSGVDSGQPVYAGRTVLGKVSAVGLFTSSVIPVTDARYAAFAQLVRKTPDGTVPGAEGILKGTGAQECRLERVDWSEPVAVGDEVYTAESTGTFRERMFYGTVIGAERKPGTNEWEIRVKPAASEQMAADVQILRARVNPSRILAE